MRERGGRGPSGATIHPSRRAGARVLLAEPSIDDPLGSEPLERTDRRPVVAELRVVVVLDDDRVPPLRPLEQRRGGAPARARPRLGTGAQASRARLAPPTGRARARRSRRRRRGSGTGSRPVRATISLMTACPGFSTPMVSRPVRRRTAQSRPTACATRRRRTCAEGRRQRHAPCRDTRRALLAAPASLGCHRRQVQVGRTLERGAVRLDPLVTRKARVVRKVRAEVVARGVVVRLPAERRPAARPRAPRVASLPGGAPDSPPPRAERTPRPRGRARRRVGPPAPEWTEASSPASGVPL